MDNSINLENGTLLQNRYEIQDRIGAGGMSDVYLAFDQSLNRQVAVKVLKTEFSEDKTFVSKFRAEAQAAAGLEHPNIVNIYDVGSEGGLYYIVMEYVEGITLKTYISKKGRLTYNEALSIAIQVGRGIEAAHNKGIVHRDIKPQNIIISKEGNVKVMDFGIARAASSNTISADLMGSVHYASPEQARNGFVTCTSDIYSLGIVMYEMVTGRVPYDGDTAVSIAIQHLQSEMVPPSAYAPDLPTAVEKVIQKATMKSQDRRYQTMSDMLTDLKKALISPDEDFVVIPENGEISNTRVITEAELREIQERTSDPSEGPSMSPRNGEGVKKNSNQKRQNNGRAERPEKERETVRAVAPPPLEDDEIYDRNGRPVKEPKPSKRTLRDDDYDDDDDEPVNPKIDKIMTLMGIAAAVVIAIIVIFLVMQIFGPKGSKTPAANSSSAATTSSAPASSSQASSAAEEPDEIKMPSLLGKTKDEVKKILSDLHLGFKDGGETSSDKYEKGLVCGQTPNDGVMVKRNSQVIVIFSSGVGNIKIPSVKGYEEAAAIKTLEDSGFKYSRTYEYSSDVERGKVISQTPSGEGKKGDVITLKISQGVETVKVPAVKDMTLDEAKGAIEGASLTLGTVTEEFSDTVEAGKIISQEPAANGYANKGAAVAVVVSKGKEEVLYRFSMDVNSVDGQPTVYTLTDANGAELATWKIPAGSSQNINKSGITTDTGTLSWKTEPVTPEPPTSSSDSSGEEPQQPVAPLSGSQKVTFVKQ